MLQPESSPFLTNSNIYLQFCVPYRIWLPIGQRIQYKILLLTFKILNNCAPSYLSDLIKPYRPSRTLRSSGLHLLPKPSYNHNCYGKRAFSCAAPELWNSFPHNIRTCHSISIFKGLLIAIELVQDFMICEIRLQNLCYLMVLFYCLCVYCFIFCLCLLIKIFLLIICLYPFLYILCKYSLLFLCT